MLVGKETEYEVAIDRIDEDDNRWVNETRLRELIGPTEIIDLWDLGTYASHTLRLDVTYEGLGEGSQAMYTITA